LSGGAAAPPTDPEGHNRLFFALGLGSSRSFLGTLFFEKDLCCPMRFYPQLMLYIHLQPVRNLLDLTFS